MLSLLVPLALAALSVAAPAERRSGVTALSSAQIESYSPFAQFARAAYCPSSSIKSWQCGEACKAIPGFLPTLFGGDGNGVQLFYVGYWPAQNSVVVAHEGTDPTQLVSDLTDANILMDNLSSSFFPGVPSSVKVHDGFRNEQALTASAILTEVKRLISVKGAEIVTCVGHSLGGALAELDSMYFTLNLASSIHVKGVTFGTPRVGNAAWASFFDSRVPDFVRINNKRDIVPIFPGRFLGFSHVHGETHLLSRTSAVSCPGDDDATDPQCQISSVPSIFSGNVIDHLGPYMDDIHIGTSYCT